MGRIGIDLVPEHDQVGKALESVCSFRRMLGGTPGNISVGASRLGLAVAVISRIGKDYFGAYILKTLKEEGIEISQIKSDSSKLTGLVIIGVNPPDDFPHVFYRDNCADMNLHPEDLDPQTIGEYKALLITGTGLSQEIMRSTTHSAIEIAKQKRTAIVLDIDYRPNLWGLTEKGEGEIRYVKSDKVTKELRNILKDMALIVGTEEEIHIASGIEDTEKAVCEIRGLSNATVVVKLGIKGCKVYPPDSEPIYVKAFNSDVLNLMGAGDAFMAGFLHQWLNSKDLERCAIYGNANSAINISRIGCAPAMATLSELKHFLNHNNYTV